MEPQEELFHLAKDPTELVNQAPRAESKEALATMRGKYDAALAHWKNNVNAKGKHQRYVKFFDRNITWQEKEIPQKGKKKEKK